MATLFERIVSGEVPAEIVFQDESVTAFRDINPAMPVHVLVIPNKLIPTVNDIEEADEPLVGHMLRVAAIVAQQEGIAENGYRLIINVNRDGGQEVMHLHLHVLGGRPVGRMVSR